uniref:Uncharacterized protein n=1 Tax=Arundo donax TaxID=35708 RepID=A0A0A9A7B4_ARUDO
MEMQLIHEFKYQNWHSTIKTNIPIVSLYYSLLS